jgi:hypothetical protein
LSSNPWSAVSDPATTTREGMVQLERALPVDLWRRICDALGVRCGAETFNETEETARH